MIKKILILSGGISKERLISLDTGLQVAKELKKNKYKVRISEPDNNLSKHIKTFNPDVIFNALHGQFGEDGYIQTILENYKIPFTHSGVIASSIAMDKEISKKIFIKNKITTPKFFIYSYNEKNNNLIKKINKYLKFPVVVKPINEGSSVNVFICNKKNIFKTLDKIKNYRVNDEEIDELFQSSTLIILPYVEATQSGIIPLAYRYKLPIIVTDVGAISDYVINEETGIVIPSKSEEQIAEAIVKLISNSNLRDDLANKGYNFLNNELSWETISKSTLKIYKKASQK